MFKRLGFPRHQLRAYLYDSFGLCQLLFSFFYFKNLSVVVEQQLRLTPREESSLVFRLSVGNSFGKPLDHNLALFSFWCIRCLGCFVGSPQIKKTARYHGRVLLEELLLWSLFYEYMFIPPNGLGGQLLLTSCRRRFSIASVDYFCLAFLCLHLNYL